jgi:ABC-type sugar transport system ATPase subunit
MEMHMDNSLLKASNVSRRSPGVISHDRVSLAVCGGKGHALLGENAAGKSAPFKILSQQQMDQIVLNLGLAFVKRIGSEGF